MSDDPEKYWQIINNVWGERNMEEIAEIIVGDKILKTKESTKEVVNEFNQ